IRGDRTASRSDVAPQSRLGWAGDGGGGAAGGAGAIDEGTRRADEYWPEYGGGAGSTTRAFRTAFAGRARQRTSAGRWRATGRPSAEHDCGGQRWRWRATDRAGDSSGGADRPGCCSRGQSAGENRRGPPGGTRRCGGTAVGGAGGKGREGPQQEQT